jgi:hypothetical protein
VVKTGTKWEFVSITRWAVSGKVGNRGNIQQIIAKSKNKK